MDWEMEGFLRRRIGAVQICFFRNSTISERIAAVSKWPMSYLESFHETFNLIRFLVILVFLLFYFFVIPYYAFDKADVKENAFFAAGKDCDWA